MWLNNQKSWRKKWRCVHQEHNVGSRMTHTRRKLACFLIDPSSFFSTTSLASFVNRLIVATTNRSKLDWTQYSRLKFRITYIQVEIPAKITRLINIEEVSGHCLNEMQFLYWALFWICLPYHTMRTRLCGELYSNTIILYSNKLWFHEDEVWHWPCSPLPDTSRCASEWPFVVF